MAVNYGYEVAPQNDPFVTKIEHFIGLFMHALTPEMAALLFAFPFCMISLIILFNCCINYGNDSLVAYIPTWLPGGDFKRRAGECRLLAKEVLSGPVQWVMDNMVSI